MSNEATKGPARGTPDAPAASAEPSGSHGARRPVRKPKLTPQGLPPAYEFNPQWEVTPRQVSAMMNSGEPFVLIDCRTPEEHRIAHIESARLVPLHTLESSLREMTEGSDKKVVVHCHHGGRSLQMTARLRDAGFKDVKSMAGGIDLWAIDIDTDLERY